MANILLTCVGGGLSKHNIFFLKKNNHYNIRIIGTDINGKNKNKKFCNKFYKVTTPNNVKKYSNQIKKIINKDKIDLIIPTSDEEALFFSKRKKNYEKYGTKVATTSLNNLKIFSNKFKTYLRLKKMNLPYPKFYIANNRKQFLNLINNFKINFVIKPAISRGGRGVFIISNLKKEKKKFKSREKEVSLKVFKKKYLKTIKKFPQLISEKLQEPVYDVDFLSKKSELKKIIFRKRIISKEPNSGHYFFSPPKKIKRIFKKICTHLKLDGLYDSDLMRDNKGNFKIIEINPRPSGSVSVTCAAADNLLSDLISLKLGNKISKNKNNLKSSMKLNK